MPDQIQNPQSQPAPPATPPAAGDRRPAIRTMKSDIQELFKNTKPSLLSIIGQEQTTAPQYRVGTVARRPYFIWVASGLTAMAVILLGVFLLKQSPAEEARKPLLPPSPFFATEMSRTVSGTLTKRLGLVRLLDDSSREVEREGVMKRILVKIQEGPQERFAAPRDLFEIYGIIPPESFTNYLSSPLMTFFYYTGGKSQFGFASRIVDPDRGLFALLSWEPSMITDLYPLFFEEKLATTLAPFEDRVYRNIDWRYQKLSEERGIGYAVFPAEKILVVTTGKEMMEVVINRLFEAR